MSRRAQSDNRATERRSMAHLQRAFALAREHHPHPNPRVGAVVVDGSGTVVGEGAHTAAGMPHAEVVALRAAGGRARGGTLYVSLEPCNHHGRTPPCTEALLTAGIERVVVAATDPDPRVAGAGIARLRAAGVDVLADVAVAAGEACDPGYFHHRRTGRPLVTLKVAATLDGQTAAIDGSSQWITSAEARREVHELRARSDAIVVGAGTLRTDDPRLDVRLDGYGGPEPRPVVVAGTGPLPADARLMGRSPLVYVPDAAAAPAGVEAVVLPGVDGVDLDAVVKDLGSRGYVDVLVEGGATLAGSMLRCGLVDRVVIYLGARVAGGLGIPLFTGEWPTLQSAIDVRIVDVSLVGGDVRIEARVGSTS